ncbi:MAG: type I-U CRISPR-associated protein Cas5/Cas6 [Planctomycetes bacterium]|nr:type I-U CRISPR-associated protein Cas5/Cas6 [Planctomycetota bacterium]
MPTLRLRFPGGRYHATPWGHHVNEGQIEWPPSPWRLLRALIACGFTTQRWREIPPVAGRLLEKLAATLPSYRLPAASAAHSRHFMPIGALDKGREKTTLVFDTWANVGDEALVIHWDCDLTDDETQQLRQLAECLGYLGRSESWVEAELVPDGVLPLNHFDAFPHRGGARPGPQWEQILLVAAIPPLDYVAWRRKATEKILADFPPPEGQRKPPARLLKDRANAIAPYPDDLLDCLVKDTAWWKQHRWSQPPGSQRVLYWRRCDAMQVGVPQRAKPQAVRPVTTMLLALTTPSGNRSALPPCSRTLPQAELFHRAIVGRVAKGQRVRCPELTGRDEQGQPLRECHRHAHILPMDLDADGHLDHLIVHAPMGLGEAAQRAIRTLRRTWTKGGVGDLQLALAGSGDLDALRSLPAPLDRRIVQLLGPPQGARVWVSATPFVPPRFIKRRGANTLLGQVNAELASRGFPPVDQLDEPPRNAETLPLRHFVRCRQRGGAPPPIDVGYALRLEFVQPIRGPLMLGYASHFGLGLFVAVPSLPS